MNQGGRHNPGATSTPKTDRATLRFERRRSQRETVLTPGMLRQLDLDDAQIMQVMVTDVSLHGVGFRTSQLMQPDLETMYFIEIGVGALQLSSRMRIIRIRRLRDGSFEVGGEFC